MALEREEARATCCVRGASLVAQVHVLTERPLRVSFLMCCDLSLLPLTMVGVLVSCILRYSLLCLWRANFIMGGNVPAWIRFMSG